MQESSLYIILAISIFFSALGTVYSFYLSVKMKRKTFYLAVFVSLSFLLFSVFILLNILNSPNLIGEIKFIPFILFLVLLWCLTLSTFSKDLQKKATKETVSKMQRIEKNEKEYLAKILKKYSKSGKSAKKAIGKNEDTITDPVFIELKHPLFIVGMKNSGKTTIGQIVATKLNVNFVDNDDVLLKSVKAKYGSLKHFYKVKGKDVYMQTESISLYNYLKENKEPSVIALGGGSAENSSLLRMVRSVGYIVLLNLKSDSLFKRIIDDGVKPAFVDNKNIEQSFNDVYESRERIYRNTSDIIVDLDEKASPYTNAHKVLTELDTFLKDEKKRSITEMAMPTNVIHFELNKESRNA